MSVARRIAELYEIKMNAVLDRATDPSEMVDYSYAQLRELLAEVRQGTANIAASRTRAERQVSGLQRAADRLGEQAEQAVAAEREDLARQALARRTALLAQASGLRDQQAALRAEEEKLSAAEQRLQAKIEAFRIQKETIKATYTAARAHASIAEAFAGIYGEVEDVDMATHRAEDQAADLQARASAREGLLTSGALGGGASALSDEELQAQLDAISTHAEVEEELARIKERLASGAGQPGDSAGDGPAGAAKAPPQDEAPQRAETGG
jgi:phage shock protein A